MRVLVCGSRTFDDAAVVCQFLHGLLVDSATADGGEFVVIEGGASGADRLAGSWAASRKSTIVEHIVCAADWARHGKAAGFIRNGEMLWQKPDLVVAFVDKPLHASRGTNHMVTLARAAGVKTVVVEVLK